MIRPLRRSHRYIWILLGFLLPALLFFALAARRTSTPTNPNVNWESFQ